MLNKLVSYDTFCLLHTHTHTQDQYCYESGKTHTTPIRATALNFCCEWPNTRFAGPTPLATREKSTVEAVDRSKMREMSEGEAPT